MFVSYLYLAIAIVAEVTATVALKATNSFTRLGPSVVVVIGYGAAFYFLSLCLRTLAVGIVYAIWSAAGIVLITLLAWLLYGQRLDLPAAIGMLLIVAGVVIIQLFSKTTASAREPAERPAAVETTPAADGAGQVDLSQ